MVPQIIGASSFVPAPSALGAPQRAEQGAQPKTGETAASAARPETVVRVDPPRVLPAPVGIPEDGRKRDTYVPPDPDGPAGPPPSFDATPLQRERERLKSVENLIPPPPKVPIEKIEPEAAAVAETGSAALGAAGAVEVRAAGSVDDDAVETPEVAATEGAKPERVPERTPETRRAAEADEEAIERVEAEVAEVRRMSEPERERSVDLVR